MKKMKLILLIFTLMNFVVSMTALVFNGILDKVAISLNVSIANSGLLGTMYAYGAALGVPVTLILFGKINRTKMLKIMLIITIIMTGALILCHNFSQLLIVRFIMGISANGYGVLATSIVISFASKNKQGRTLAFLIMGSSLALVVGIPLTRILSNTIDWRVIFLGLMVIMVFSLIIFQFFLPETNQQSRSFDFENEFNLFKKRKTLVVIGSSIIIFIGYGSFYNYITPYLLETFPATEKLMSGFLVILGIASFIGNLLGGFIADCIGYRKSLLIGCFLQFLFIGFIYIFQSNQWLSIMFAILWQMSAWFIGLQLNTGIAQATKNKSSFIISLNSSAIQLGTAVGANISASLIATVGMEKIILVSLLASAIMTIIQFISLKQDISNTTENTVIE